MRKAKIIGIIILVLFANWFINPETVPSNKYLTYKDKKMEPVSFSEYPLYSHISCTDEGFIGVSDFKKKFGYLDENGNTLIPFQYDQVTKFSEGLAAVCINKKWGYINTQNEIIIPFIFDRAYPFKNKRATVEIKSKRGIIDTDGNIVIPIIYDNILDYYSASENKHSYIVYSNKKYGLIDEENNVILPVIYDELTSASKMFVSKKYIIVKKDNLYGAVKINGELVFPVEYEYIDMLDENTVILEKNNLYALYTMDGKAVVPYSEMPYENMGKGYLLKGIIKKPETLTICDYTGKELVKKGKYCAHRSENDYAVVTKITDKELKDWHYGLVDKNGKTVLKPVYDAIDYINNGYYFFIRGNKKGIIKDGKEVLYIDYDIDVPIYSIADGNFYFKNKAENIVYIISEEGKPIKKISASLIDRIGNLFIVYLPEGNLAVVSAKEILK